MALHPDGFHDDLEKIIYHCDENIEIINNFSDKYNRLHLYLPVVVLRDDLYIAEPRQKNVNLKKVNIGHYMYFGIKNREHFLAHVVFLTENHLLKFLDEINKIVSELEKESLNLFTKKP